MKTYMWWFHIDSMLYRFQADTSVSLHLPDLEFLGFTPGPGVVQLPIRLGRIWYRIQVQHFDILLSFPCLESMFSLSIKLLKLLYFCATMMFGLGNRASKVLCPISISTSLIAPTADILELWSKPSWSVGAVRLGWFVCFRRVWCLHPHIWS